jgi:outer membrane protein W
MRLARIVQILTVASVCSVLALSPSLAEDTKGKWQFGFGISFYSTKDYIRSNSDVALAGAEIGETGLPAVGFVDPRPDSFMLNKPSIEDDFKFDFTASYGLTRWLAVELGASYLKAPVGNIEIHIEDRDRSVGDGFASTVTGCGPNPLQPERCYTYAPASGFSTKTNGFLQVGEITEIPIQLSALARFRPESPFDPYVGLGIGYIFTDMETSAEFNALSDHLESQMVNTFFEGDITDLTNPTTVIPFPGINPVGMTAEVKDAFEWHAVGGVDYYVNERFSFYVDARWVSTSGNINIQTDGYPQVILLGNELGRLQNRTLDTAWEDNGFAGCDNGGVNCAGDGFFQTEDFNGNGVLDTEDLNGNGILDAGEDYNGNGLLDTEDNGTIYYFPLGPNPEPGPTGNLGWGQNADETALGSFTCVGCDGNGVLDTEDLNDNLISDRFLYYGIDICSTAEGVGSQFCSSSRLVPGISPVQYVFPGGPLTACKQAAVGSSRTDEGCPIVPTGGGGLSTAARDNTNDTYLIQGGKIKLGGFSLGVGFKFTF